jgi:hypothetical protein
MVAAELRSIEASRWLTSGTSHDRRPRERSTVAI